MKKLLFLLLWCSVTANAADVFALLDQNDTASTAKTYLDMPVVDGIAIRTSWAKLETTDNGYQWASLDSLLAQAKASGKKATLHVLGSGYVSAPSWLKAKTYSYTAPNGRSATDPVPWDSVFLSKWFGFMLAMGDHVQQKGYASTVAYVSVSAPVPEMSLPACANGALTPEIKYNRTKYLAAWKKTAFAASVSFPAALKLLPAPVSQICRGDNDGTTFYQQVLSYASAFDDFALYATDLNALGSQRLSGIDQTEHAVAFQTIWSATNDTSHRMQGTLKQAVCYGLSLSGDYFEIYKIDLSNKDTSIQNAISLAKAGKC